MPKGALFTIILSATPYSNHIRDIFSLIELLYNNPDQPNETFEQYYNKKYSAFKFDSLDNIFTAAKIYGAQTDSLLSKSFEENTASLFASGVDKFFDYDYFKAIYAQVADPRLKILNAFELQKMRTALDTVTSYRNQQISNVLNYITTGEFKKEFYPIISYFKSTISEGLPKMRENILEEINISSKILDNLEWLNQDTFFSRLDKKIIDESDNEIEKAMASILLSDKLFTRVVQKSFDFRKPLPKIQTGQDINVKIVPQQTFAQWYKLYFWAEKFDFSSYFGIKSKSKEKKANQPINEDETTKAAFYVETRQNANVLSTFNLVKKTENLVNIVGNQKPDKILKTTKKNTSKKNKLLEIFYSMESVQY